MDIKGGALDMKIRFPATKRFKKIFFKGKEFL